MPVSPISVESYKRMIADGKAVTGQQKIMRALLYHHKGLTRREVEVYTGMRPNQVTGRMAELIKAGVVEEVGTRVNPETGHRGAVCVLRNEFLDQVY